MFFFIYKELVYLSLTKHTDDDDDPFGITVVRSNLIGTKPGTTPLIDPTVDFHFLIQARSYSEYLHIPCH